MEVYTNGFWPGFAEETDGVHFGFFKHILKMCFKTEIKLTTNLNNADILLESHFGQTLIHSKKWKYSIFFSGEASISPPDHINDYSLVLGAQKVNNNFVSCSLGIMYHYCSKKQPAKKINNMPIKNICAIISSPVVDDRFRYKFIDYLESNGIHVDMAGRYKNNIGFTVEGSYFTNQILDFQRQYKIVLALENTKTDDYITEKIFNPLYAGTIPVYFGSNKITDYISNDRIIIVDEHKPEKALEEICELIENNEKWLRKVNGEPFVFNLDEYIDNIVNNMRSYLNLYSAEIIWNSEKEPERLTTLIPILNFYNCDSSCETYGVSAKSHKYFNKFNPSKHINAISLAINHITLLEKYLDKNEYVLIFESDVVPVKSMNITHQEISYCIQEMKDTNTDFVFLGYGCFQNTPWGVYVHSNRKISQNLFETNTSRCTEAYIVSPRGIKEYLNYFYKTENHDVIDADYNHFFKNVPSVKSCWRIPELFNQGTHCGLYRSNIPIQ
jgi:hypothetical protein